MPTSRSLFKMNTPLCSHSIDIMVPNAPKKPFAPLTLYRSDSYEVEEFLAAVSNYHPADAIIMSGDGDTEDTANSCIEKSSIMRKITKYIQNIFCA